MAYQTLNNFLKHLSKTQFIIINGLLAGLLFYKELFPIDFPLFFFVLLPMMCCALTLKNNKNNHYLLIGIGIGVWIFWLSIFSYLDFYFFNKKLGLFSFNNSLSKYTIYLAIFGFYAILILLLTKYATQNKKPLTPLIFIPISILVLFDGLLGNVLSTILSLSICIWIIGILFNYQFIKNYTINIGIAIIIIAGFEILTAYHNHKSEKIAHEFLAQIDTYYHTNHHYPTNDKASADQKVHYLWIIPYDSKTPPYPKLYWKEHKNPYCQHRFDFDTREWLKECRD